MYELTVDEQWLVFQICDDINRYLNQSNLERCPNPI
jgi:hypothetical protein